MKIEGDHVICDVIVANFQENFIKLAKEAIKTSKMKIVGFKKYEFKPQGTTAVWLLSESHFIIHTYPEHNYYSIDCYTCGNEGHPIEAINHFINNFKVISLNIKQIKRGVFNKKIK